MVTFELALTVLRLKRIAVEYPVQRISKSSIIVFGKLVQDWLNEDKIALADVNTALKMSTSVARSLVYEAKFSFCMIDCSSGLGTSNSAKLLKTHLENLRMRL